MDLPAASVYETRLRVRGRLATVLLVPFVLIRNAVVGALGLSADGVAPAATEVVNRTDGSLVGRIPVGSSYDEQVDMLASVRRSLESKSKSEFLANWDLDEG